MTQNTLFQKIRLFLASLFMVAALAACGAKETKVEETTSSSSKPKETATYQVSEEEKAQLKARFETLSNTNKETIGFIYIPGAKLEEPIVQTTDNATYLDKTFEGENVPLMGSVFMDMENSKVFDDQLTWLFGHARGIDHRMFNDVNYYQKQEFFDQHPYVVVETPERKYYYEAAWLMIVPENTALYNTSFPTPTGFTFKDQLKEVSEKAHTKNPNIKLNDKDKYLCLSTCLVEDDTIRSNLYLRQIPDSELPEFLKKHGDKLNYVATR